MFDIEIEKTVKARIYSILIIGLIISPIVYSITQMSSSSGFSRILNIFNSRNGRLLVLSTAGLAVGAGVYLFTRRTNTDNAATEATQTGTANSENKSNNDKDEDKDDDDDEDEESEEEGGEDIATTNIPEARTDQLGLMVRSPIRTSSSMTRPQVVALVSLFANTVVCYVFAIMAALEARRELPHFAIPVAWTGVGALVGILVQFFRRRNNITNIPHQQTLPTQEVEEEEEEEKDSVSDDAQATSSSNEMIQSAQASKIVPTPSSKSSHPTPTTTSSTTHIIKTPVVSSTAPIRRLEFTTTSSSATTAAGAASTAERMLKFPGGSPAASPYRSGRGGGGDDDEPQPPSAGGGGGRTADTTQKKGTGKR